MCSETLLSPCRRLTTQNFLITCSNYERDKSLDLHSINDLSTLIDLFCLYDDVGVLGRQTNTFFDQNNSDLADLFKETDFIRILEGYEDQNKVAETTCMHLRAFLGEHKADHAAGLVRYVLSPERFNFGFTLKPHQDDEFLLGQRLIQNASSLDEIIARLDKKDYEARQIMFVTRTFVYVGYSNVHQIPFTPDAVRLGVLSKALSRQGDLRLRLLEHLKSSIDESSLDAHQELQRTVTPLASIVFDRAWPHKNNIPKVMAGLRKELAPLRQRLREAEDAALWGMHLDESSATHKWNQVFHEIERTMGRGERLISIRRALNFASVVAPAADDFRKASSIMKAILDLPIEITQRLIARQPAIELFHLQKSIPGSGRTRRRVRDLFDL
jgi:hypothetical protein